MLAIRQFAILGRPKHQLPLNLINPNPWTRDQPQTPYVFGLWGTTEGHDKTIALSIYQLLEAYYLNHTCEVFHSHVQWWWIDPLWKSHTELIIFQCFFYYFLWVAFMAGWGYHTWTSLYLLLFSQAQEFVCLCKNIFYLLFVEGYLHEFAVWALHSHPPPSEHWEGTWTVVS